MSASLRLEGRERWASLHEAIGARFWTPAKGAVLLAAVLFAWWCYARQASNPWCCDFGSYVGIAHQYTLRGLIADTSGTRLYGYPALVAVALALGRLARVDLMGLLYLMQVATYLVAATLVARCVWRWYSARIGSLAFFALVGNVFVYPYLTVPLADGVAVAALLLVAHAALRIVQHPHGVRTLAWWGWAGALLGFAVMVRPANIGWLLLLAPLAWHARVTGAGWLFAALSAATLGYALAVAPQVYLNVAHFDTFGFLPPRDIGGEQVQWGLDSLKYATDVNPLTVAWYANPWAPSGEPGLGWYFTDIDGVRTILLRMLSAFDVDSLLAYPNRRDPLPIELQRVLSPMVLFWGGVAATTLARAWRGAHPGINLDARVRTLLASGAVLALVWCAVHAPTAMENRFVLPMLAVLGPLAAWRISLLDARRRGDLVLLAGFVLFMAAWWALAVYLTSIRA